MNETIWMCTEDFTIYPNREAARESYAKWCIEHDETYIELVFENCYTSITFEDYNNLYVLRQRESAIF